MATRRPHYCAGLCVKSKFRAAATVELWSSSGRRAGDGGAEDCGTAPLALAAPAAAAEPVPVSESEIMVKAGEDFEPPSPTKKKDSDTLRVGPFKLTTGTGMD
jgi:hypothetical protein